MSKDDIQNTDRFGEAAKIFQVLSQGSAVAVQPSPFNIVYKGKDGWKTLEGFHKLEAPDKMYLLDLVVGAQDSAIKRFLAKVQLVEKKKAMKAEMQLQVDASQELQEQLQKQRTGLVQATSIPQLG